MAERVCCSYQNVLSIQNRVCCLYRVSTTKQVDHDDQNQADIPVQRKACREFAERMGWTIVYEEQENGVSGFKVSANDRDKIQLIKEYAEQGKFDILLVFMFDRTRIIPSRRSVPPRRRLTRAASVCTSSRKSVTSR